MNQNLDTFCYIQEQTSFVEDYANNFGYKVYDKGSRFYLIFDAVLQSFDVMNRNRRMYEASNIMDKINNDDYIQSMLRQNSWMGEIDHPAAEKEGETLSLNRISNPNMRLTSHYIRRPRLNGNLLEATIQTDSSNENGMNMAIKIVDGKIIPCFSARVLGALQQKMGRPVVNVRKLITYDWVLYPSHKEAEAKITQPIQESVVNEAAKYANCTVVFFPELARMATAGSKEATWLCESFGLSMDDVVGVTSTGNSVVLTENQNVYIQPINDTVIRNANKKMLKDWLNQ
jgi:hypothetical protein